LLEALRCMFSAYSKDVWSRTRSCI